MKKDSNYKKYLYLIFILIFLIVSFGIYKLSNTNKSPLLDKNKEIVYLYYNNDELDQKVPAVNIKNISNNINNSINEFANKYLDKEYNIDYHYNISGNILSLLIIVSDYSREGSPDYTFRSYIINIKELKVLNNEEILDLFNINMDNLVNKLNSQFMDYYNDEINKDIIDKNISYEDYLKSHEINNFNDQIYFDVVNSKLEVYIDFNEFASIEKNYYFNDIGHIFYYE